MKPDFVVMTDHIGRDDEDAKTKWCMENVGKPFTAVERPYEGVPYGFNYENDVEGTWCAYVNNPYVYGPKRPVDTWCFIHSIDANAFSLRWQ